mgnify:CR=1 FL=1
MSLALRLGYDGPVKVWVDGTPVFHDPAGSNPARIDAATVPFRAAAGRHAIVIALGSNGGKACGVFCRVERRDLTARQLNADPPRYRMPKTGLPA